MQIIQSPFENEKDEPVLENIGRKNSLAISALLNDVSIDPLQYLLALNSSKNINKPQSATISCVTEVSPITSESSSPTSEYSNNSSTTDVGEILWSYSRTGMHQVNNRNTIIVSALQKAKRKRILPHQYNKLMEVFKYTDTPSSELRESLGIELDMTKREVQVWFQNRRAKMNRNKGSTLKRHHSFQYDRKNRTDASNAPPTKHRSSEYSLIAPNTRTSLYSPNEYHPSPPDNSYYTLSSKNNTTKMQPEVAYCSTLPSKNHVNSATDLLTSAATKLTLNELSF